MLSSTAANTTADSEIEVLSERESELFLKISDILSAIYIACEWNEKFLSLDLKTEILSALYLDKEDTFCKSLGVPTRPGLPKFQFLKTCNSLV